MNIVDWVIIAFTALLAIRGYSRGFIVGVLSLGGFIIGAVLGARIGPLVLAKGSQSPYAGLFSLGGALLIGGLLGTCFEGLALRARRFLWIPGLRLFDGVLGAALTACVALGIAWIAGAALQQNASSSELRADLDGSKILRRLDQLLPPTGPILGDLARIDPLPSVSGPSANVAAPSPQILAASGVRDAAASVVRIDGDACGLGIEGSGWVAAPDTVVTNAHVVAGESDTSVQRRGVGSQLPAQVIVFDPTNDIAILHVPGLDEPTLQIDGRPAVGTSAAILGYPENGPYAQEPGRLGDTRLTATQNAYGDGPVLRQIAAVRGRVRPGNSGGPMIDADGEVVAVVFAEITNAPKDRPGGFAVPTSVVQSELAKALRAHGSVSTQSCAD